MIPTRVTAALFVAGMVTATAQAHADPPAPADQAFLQNVQSQHLPVPSDAFAIDLAHSTCDVLVSTNSLPTALHHVRTETGWTDARDVGAFGSFAVQAYCPAAAPARP